jgi:hypothetical protein
MAFGDKVKWTADNTVPVGAKLQHALPSIFPWDATLFIPKGAPEPVILTVDEAAKLQALEDAGTGLPQEVIDSERTLHEIVKNPYMAESVRVSAARLILERHDSKTIIAALRGEIEALKSGKLEEFESA